MWQGVGHRVTVKEISGQWNGENQLKMDNALKYVCVRARAMPQQGTCAEGKCGDIEKEKRE